MTAVIGSRQNRRLTPQQIRQNPNFKRQFLRIVAKGQQFDEMIDELAAVEVNGGSFVVRDSSVLDGAALNVVRSQDIHEWYDGSHLVPSSVKPLVQFLVENHMDKMQGLAGAHGLSLKNEVTFTGQPTAAHPVDGKLHFSELEADSLLRKGQEKRRELESRRGSVGDRQRRHAEGALCDDSSYSPQLPVPGMIPNAPPAWNTLFAEDELKIQTGTVPDRHAPGTDTAAARIFGHMSMKKTNKRAWTEGSAELGADVEQTEQQRNNHPSKRMDRGIRGSGTNSQASTILFHQTGTQRYQNDGNAQREQSSDIIHRATPKRSFDRGDNRDYTQSRIRNLSSSTEKPPRRDSMYSVPANDWRPSLNDGDLHGHQGYRQLDQKDRFSGESWESEGQRSASRKQDHVSTNKGGARRNSAMVDANGENNSAKVKDRGQELSRNVSEDWDNGHQRDWSYRDAGQRDESSRKENRRDQGYRQDVQGSKPNARSNLGRYGGGGDGNPNHTPLGGRDRW